MATLETTLVVTVVILLCGVTPNRAQTCPDVDVCINTFSNAMKSVGHDKGEYCKEEHLMIQCIERSICTPVTEDHKERELRHFKNDGQCDTASALKPRMEFVLLPIFATSIAAYFYHSLTVR